MPRFQIFQERSDRPPPTVIVPSEDVEANEASREPAPERARELVRQDRLDVEGSVSATFPSSSPLKSVSVTLKYKSEKLYPNIPNLPSVPDYQPSSSSSFQPSAPPMMEDFGNNMDTNTAQERPSSAFSIATTDSGIEDRQEAEHQDATPQQPHVLPVSVPSASQGASTSQAAAQAASVDDDAESEIDPSDREEGEISESDSEFETADEDSNPGSSRLRSLSETARATFRQDRTRTRAHQRLQGKAADAAVHAGAGVPAIVAGQPGFGAHGVVGQPLGQVQQAAPAAIPLVAVPNVVAPPQLPARRARVRGAQRGNRGRPRRQQIRKRPWDLSDESLSPVDEEAAFPTRISPRKKPFQGYKF